MAKLYAGTSGWAYPSWKPRFYPAKLASGKFLNHYASRLNTVEVNYTFRHFATEKTQTNWNACTPPDFKFSIKAHQNITHVRRLRDAAEITRSFLASLQPLASAGKIAMVLFQLPPFLKADAPLLTDFLSGLPKAGRFSFEFRHASWFNEQIYDALRQTNVALCLAENEKLETPNVVTADFCYYRLRKPEYSTEERQRYKETFRRHVEQGHDVFVYFKHE
ncbi:MAG TPA: DUF72 domain-containing protein, partial [Candidatus Angelobacter sp.]|nr:DUF72 domain-containing protein [Candidatus Angelobacter sp.]